ncbi:MAG: hypothetical protein WCO52_06270 [bacterium]
MPVTVGHAKSITIADGTNTNIVLPSNWNSVHAVTLSLAGNEVVKVFQAGTNTISSGTLSFADSNGITFGMATNGVITGTVKTDYQSAGAYLTTAQPVGAYLTTAAQSNHSHNFATTTTNGSVIVVGTTGSAGVTIAVPPYLTTTAAQSVQPVAYAAGGTTNNFSTLVFGNSNGLSWSTGTQGVFPSVAVLTTAMASNAGSNFAGLSTGATGASITVNSQGINVNVPAGTDTWFATGANTIAGTNTSGTFANDQYVISGAGGVSVGISNNTVVISGANAGVVNQTGPNIAASNGTITAGTVLFSNANGVSFGLNGSTMTASVPLNATLSQRYQFPVGAMSALSAFGNGSFSIERIDLDQDLSATRVDHPILWSVATSATANTWGFVMTAIGAIYSKNASTLSLITSGSTNYAFTLASNTAGSTQMGVNAIRPVSIPMNVALKPGEYYQGFGISTNTVSSGTATTALGLTISAMGMVGYSGAVGIVGDFTATTNTSTGLYGGHGVYSAAFISNPPNLSISDINQSGSYSNRANIALIYRNI